MSKPKPAGTAKRNAELAAIHIAKAEASMDDDAYRDMLWTIGRVRSAADLDFAGRRRVLDHLRKLSGDEWAFAKSMPPARQKMLWKIRRVCIELGIRRGNQVVYAEGVAARQLGVDRKLRMMDEGELWRVIGPLNNTLNHKRLTKATAP